MARLERIVSFQDFRREARRRLPRVLFDYVDGGSYGEETLARNRADFAAIEIAPRIMVDVSLPDSRVELLGQSLSLPLVLAPVGFAGMYARRGEVQAARAARAAGVPFTLSTLSICSIEEVAEGAGIPPWFQLYVIRDRGYVAELLARAKAAGCPVLVLTADLQVPGTRYRDVRSGMTRRPGVAGYLARAAEGLSKADWSLSVFARGRPHRFGNLDGVLPESVSFPEAWAWIAENFDPSLNWTDLDFIRQHWDGPILLKGVMTPRDARLALDHGVSGIVVSNHGGRQLDGAPSSISVLPAIGEAADGQMAVLLDSGIRSGLDILKALDRGADAVMAGRHWAFALAAGGEAGVAKMLSLYKNELQVAQALSARLHLPR